MKVLTKDEFRIWEQLRKRVVTVKPGAVQGAVVLVFYCIMLLVGYEFYFKIMPYALAVVLMMIMAFLLWLQVFSFYRQQGSFSWVMIIHEGFLVVKPRSILNESNKQSDPSCVLLLRADEVESMHFKSGVLKSSDASSGTRYEFFSPLDIRVVNYITDEVRGYFESEQTKWLSLSSKFLHFPVIYCDGVITINWKGEQFMLSPSMSQLAKKLDGEYEFLEHNKISKEFDDSFDGLKEYLHRGSFVNAVRLVRRLRGCSLVEAIRVVTLVLADRKK